MNTNNDFHGPLAGLNVIDFGHYYAGPMAAMLLADQGANVISIVRPGEPELPSQQYRLLNRNKKLLTLDLKTTEGKMQAESLIERADVVIENFRPGVMKRLGLDYASVKDKSPRLIYLSLPGFASTDKERAQLQAWEGILAAASGLFRHLSLFRETLKYPPLYTSIPLCSVYGSINGAIAIMAALIARETHGLGTVIEVPLASGGLLPNSGHFSLFMPAEEALSDELQALTYNPLDSHAVQEEKIEQARLATLPFGYTDYPCGDGRRINFTLVSRFTDRLIKILGIDKQLYQEGFVNAGDWISGLDNNMGNVMGNLAGSGLSTERQQRFAELVSQALQTKGAEEWEALFQDAGIPAAMLRTRQEWLSIKPLQTSGVFTRMLDQDLEWTVPGRLVDISGPKDSLLPMEPKQAKPVTFAQAETVFHRNRPYQPSAPEPATKSRPLKKGDLLKGLKVLDMGNILAGPIAGHLLAEYGADVIKADSSGTTAYFPCLVPAIMELNQGKRSILTDVTTAPGREILQRLVSWADLVTHNILDDTAKRLGVTQPQLQTINPDIVSMQISAYGGTCRGGWEIRAGFDDLLQSACGIKAHMGSSTAPHWHGYIATGDIPGGLSSAFAALLGVYQKRKTGHAGECRTSLARTVNYSQLPWMIAENDRSDWGEPRGQFALGPHWWQRLYECNDGWIYVGTSEERANILAETVTKQTITEQQSSNNEQALEAAFAKQDCDTWLKKLGETDIASHRVLSMSDIRAGAKVRPVSNEEADEVADDTLEVLRWEHHPCGSPATMLAPDTVRVGEDHSYKRPTPASRLGEHTIAILQELGYQEGEIAELIRLKVAHEYYPPLGSIHAFFEPEQ